MLARLRSCLLLDAIKIIAHLGQRVEQQEGVGPKRSRSGWQEQDCGMFAVCNVHSRINWPRVLQSMSNWNTLTALMLNTFFSKSTDFCYPKKTNKNNQI